MNGHLERMVYSGSMDMATYQSWQNTLDDLAYLAFHLLVSLSAVVALVLTYWLLHRLLTRKKK